MVTLKLIVQVFGAAMLDAGQDRTQRGRVALRFVGDDPLRNHAGFGDGALEEGPCRRGVAPLAELRIDDLSML